MAKSTFVFVQKVIPRHRRLMVPRSDKSGYRGVDVGFVTLPDTSFTVTGAGLPRDILIVSGVPKLRLPNGYPSVATVQLTAIGSEEGSSCVVSSLQSTANGSVSLRTSVVGRDN